MGRRLPQPPRPLLTRPPTQLTAYSLRQPAISYNAQKKITKLLYNWSHGLINKKDIKAKCRHLKILPVKGLFAASALLSEAPLPSKVFVWGGLAIL